MNPRAFRLSDGWLCLLPITCPCAIEVFDSRQIVRFVSVYLAPFSYSPRSCEENLGGQNRVIFVLRILRAQNIDQLNTESHSLERYSRKRCPIYKYKCWYEVGKAATVVDSGCGVRTPSLGFSFSFTTHCLQKFEIHKYIWFLIEWIKKMAFSYDFH